MANITKWLALGMAAACFAAGAQDFGEILEPDADEFGVVPQFRVAFNGGSSRRAKPHPIGRRSSSAARSSGRLRHWAKKAP